MIFDPCITSDFMQHGDDFQVFGLTSKLECLAEEFKSHFLVKKAEIVHFRQEHQSETHLLQCFICVDEFGWHVELGQWCVRSFFDAMTMNHCEAMATIGSKGQESNGSTAKLDEKEHTEFRFCAGICLNIDRATLRHCNQNEGNHERGKWTNHSLTDKVEADRALHQKTPAMCVKLLLGYQVGGRLPCDSGCRLGWGSKHKVLHVWRGYWQLARASLYVIGR